MKILKDHTLYYKPACPYCIKVMRFLAENSLKVSMLDTRQEENANALIELGGKKQVPCLIVEGKPLYESSDIIEYLKQYTN